MNEAKSKLDHVRDALRLLSKARTSITCASADFGTPTEIEDAEVLTRQAFCALERLKFRLKKGGR